MISRAAELLRESRNPVVFSGAGMSRESGMRTFRGEEGLWKEYSPEQLSSLSGLRSDPEVVWEWYKMRLITGDGIVPHAGYKALTFLQKKKGTLPVITQNVDGLHKLSGQTDVLEIHGSMRTASCLDRCGFFTELNPESLQDLPPLCPDCGAILRPDIVLFGEPLPHQVISRSYKLAEECDLMMVIGTSVQVWPAAGVPFAALENGATVIEINPARTELPQGENVISIRGKAGEILPALVDMEENK
ncbi:MAG: NAD-dependent deacylase [Candidatus Sabulitectum sp.]|nr:NAD-dependent deacylase [Candidatus Sabulitectum sp.]